MEGGCEAKQDGAGARLLFLLFCGAGVHGVLPERLSAPDAALRWTGAGVVQWGYHAVRRRSAAAGGALGGSYRSARAAADAGAGGVDGGRDDAGASIRFWGALGWGILWECARSSCAPLADRSTVGLCGAQSYGKLRCFGSLGFLAGGAGLGFLTRRWGLERLLFPIYLSLAAAALLLSFGLHQEENVRRERPKRVWRTLLHTPVVRLALLLGAQGGAAVNALQPLSGRLPCGLAWGVGVCAGVEYPALCGAGAAAPAVGQRETAAEIRRGEGEPWPDACAEHALHWLCAGPEYGDIPCGIFILWLYRVRRHGGKSECSACGGAGGVLCHRRPSERRRHRPDSGRVRLALRNAGGYRRGQGGLLAVGRPLSLAAAWVLWIKRDVFPNESAGH